MHCNAFAVNNVMQQQNGPFRRCRGDGSAERGRSVIYDCLIVTYYSSNYLRELGSYVSVCYVTQALR